MSFSLEALQTSPAVESADARAWDTADQLGLRLWAQLSAENPGLAAKPVLTIGDNFGALTLGICAQDENPASQVRAFQDLLLARQALLQNTQNLEECLPVKPVAVSLEPESFAGVGTVVMRLPKDLRLLDLYAQMIATFADKDVQVIAVGKIKHMTRSMNEVLKKYFGEVKASLGWKKSRALLASSSLPQTLPEGEGATGWKLPFTYASDAQTGISFASLPGVFSAGRLDIGTRFLLQNLTEQTVPETGIAADLGCGTGVVAAKLMQLRPQLQILATDVSSLAVLSTQKTMQMNLQSLDDSEGESLERASQYRAVQADGLAQCEPDSLDLVVCNPPFHAEYEITTQISEKLFRQAHRALKPGGKMITVYNTHLQYRPLLERVVGPTRQLGRNAKFTLVLSTVLPS